MRMSRQKCTLEPKYYINNLEVKVAQEFKYLGVHISNKCGWQNHIQHVTSKGNQMLRFIKRNFKDCPQSVKETVYLSLVRPLLEYASCVWDPSAEGLKQDLEMVQRRAARFVLNDFDRNSSVDQMLSKIGWERLEKRRKQARLCLLFKFYHDIIKVDASSIILDPNYVGRKDHNKKIRRIQSRLFPYHTSFFPKTIRDWNTLPGHVIETNNLMEFKKLLNNG